MTLFHRSKGAAGSVFLISRALIVHIWVLFQLNSDLSRIPELDGMGATASEDALTGTPYLHQSLERSATSILFFAWPHGILHVS